MAVQIFYTMYEYGTFLEYIVPHVPGVPEVLAKRCVRDTVIDFCDETKLYEAVLDGTLVKAGIIEVPLELPNGTKLAGVSKLTLSNGEVLEPMSQYIIKQDTIELVQPLSQDNVITATVALKPSRQSINCPSFIFEDWAEVIGYGAQAMLFNMANEEWQNPRAAAAAYSLYRNGVAKAKRYAKTGRVMGNTNAMIIDLS